MFWCLFFFGGGGGDFVMFFGVRLVFLCVFLVFLVFFFGDIIIYLCYLCCFLGVFLVFFCCFWCYFWCFLCCFWLLECLGLLGVGFGVVVVVLVAFLGRGGGFWGAFLFKGLFELKYFCLFDLFLEILVFCFGFWCGLPL